MTEIENLTEEEQTERTNKIRIMFKKALDYGDDKVNLAMQTYEMVKYSLQRPYLLILNVFKTPIFCKYMHLVL